MDKQKQHGIDDKDLFQQETRDVVPLKTPPRSESRAPRKTTRTGQQKVTARSEAPVATPPRANPEQAGSDEASSWRRNGVQTRLLQKLKRGRFPPGDQLDLHHETVAVAHAMLQGFIADAQDRRLQSIRIIHGKGLRSKAGPVLKHMVHQALREHNGVLAFATCKPAHGGSGAVDVLLSTA